MDQSIIPYGKPFVDQNDIQAVVEVLKSDFLTQGESGKVFEKSLAEYCGSNICRHFFIGYFIFACYLFLLWIRFWRSSHYDSDDICCNGQCSFVCWCRTCFC